VNGASPSPSPSSTPQPAKRARPRATPTKAAVTVASSARLLASSSMEDDTSSMESTSTSNSIHSTIADLLDRCSSPPLATDTFENEVRLCLMDLCQRVVSMFDEPIHSTSILYNPIPSPTFKRKMDEPSNGGKRNRVSKMSESPNSTEDPTTKKKRNRSSVKKPSVVDTLALPRKEEMIESESIDIKPTLSQTSIITSTPPPPPTTSILTNATTDYMCDWDNCRK
jgi:hypothetical protein